MPENPDIIGDAVRNTFNSAMEKPRAAMKAVSDAASSVADRVKSIVPKSDKPVATWDTSKPAPKATPSKPAGPMPKYHKGTDYVPKTGPAILKKGEAVLNNKEAAEHRAMKHGMEGAASELGGKSEKPKKELKEIRTRKGKSGGYIHEHHHTAPEHHPMEEHTSADQDGMMAHMMEHMGTPNPGEAEADAGQSGVPAAGAAAGGAAPAAGAPAGM